MARGEKNCHYGTGASSETKGRPSESKFKLRTDAVQRTFHKHGPLYCRAVVPAYATRDFENGNYPPWYVAHVDPDMVSDEMLAGLAEDYADQDGYLFHSTDGLSSFMQVLEQEHGYISLFTYHDDYCTLDGPKENEE